MILSSTACSSMPAMLAYPTCLPEVLGIAGPNSMSDGFCTSSISTVGSWKASPHLKKIKDQSSTNLSSPPLAQHGQRLPGIYTFKICYVRAHSVSPGDKSAKLTKLPKHLLRYSDLNWADLPAPNRPDTSSAIRPISSGIFSSYLALHSVNSMIVRPSALFPRATRSRLAVVRPLSNHASKTVGFGPQRPLCTTD